jgi:hypothetical protein
VLPVHNEGGPRIRHCGCNLSDITVDLSISPIGDIRGRIGDCVPIFFPGSDHQCFVILPSGTGDGGDLGGLTVKSKGKRASLWRSPKFRSRGKKGILSRDVVLHADPPDPTSRPAGNSGARIACGVIDGSSRKDNDK